MRALVIGLNGMRRLLRDRSNIFFVFILPLALVLLIGAQFGSGGGARVVVAHGGGSQAQGLVDELGDEGIVVVEVEGEAAVVDDVERGRASAGVVVPADLEEAVAAGRPVQVGFVARPDSSGTLQPVVGAALAEVTADDRVARVVAERTGQPYARAREAVVAVEGAGVRIVSETVGESLFAEASGQFSVGAAQQLVLFVFLTALTGSAALIQSRQLGVTGRMLSTPTSVGEIVVGEGLGRFFTGLFQGAYIVVVTLVVFGVDWGDPLGWVLLLIGLSATGAGAAMLIGSVFESDQQAGGISVMVALGLAALGGSMLPLDLFSPTLRRVAHLTPHAWAVDGFGDLVWRGGSAVDVVGEAGVLLAYAAVLLTVASWRLRRVMARAL